MRIPEHPTQIRRMLDARRKQLAGDQPVLAATLSRVGKTCATTACPCHSGGPKHEAHHLTYKVQGKTHTVYVPKDLVAEVRSWLDEHQRLKHLLQEISQLSLALVKTHARHQRRKKGRP